MIRLRRQGGLLTYCRTESEESECTLHSNIEAELKQYHQDLFGWALVCCHWVQPEAEEVLQETYLKILDGRARFHGRSSFKTWLFAVLRHTAAEHRRASRFRELARLRWGKAHRPTVSHDAAGGVYASQANARLVAALAKLPARQRQVLHLVFYQDLSIREAADILGVHVGTARAHYERGKRSLRALLEKEYTV